MSLPGLPLALPPGQIEALRAAYAQPPREYHDFGHVGEVLRHYAAVAARPGWQKPVEVALAVLYHDAVYVAGKGIVARFTHKDQPGKPFYVVKAINQSNVLQGAVS